MQTISISNDKARSVAEIKSALLHYGFEVDESSSGSAGLRKAINDNFDVIDFDRMLPKIDGLALLTKLRVTKVSAPVTVGEKQLLGATLDKGSIAFLANDSRNRAA